MTKSYRIVGKSIPPLSCLGEVLNALLSFWDGNASLPFHLEAVNLNYKALSKGLLQAVSGATFAYQKAPRALLRMILSAACSGEVERREQSYFLKDK